MELSLEQYDALSPLFAYLDQKSEAQQHDILTKFGDLSKVGRTILAGTETADKIFTLISRGIIPETHGKAVAIMIALVAFGDITTDQLVPLLEKLGLNNTQAQQTAENMNAILQPLLIEKQAEPIEMTALPPMTRPMEEGPKPLTPSVPKINVPAKNVVDLRNPNSSNP